MISVPKSDNQIISSNKEQNNIAKTNKGNDISEEIEISELETKTTTEKDDTFVNSPNIRKLRRIRRYINAIVVRFMFLAVPGYQIYVLSCIYSEPLYYLLYISYPIIILDCIWVLWKRDGRDYYWFSISFAVYIVTMIIVIVFQMNFKYEADDIHCKTNRTKLATLGCTNQNDTFELCTAVEVGVVAFLASLVVGRWLLPQARRMNHHANYTQVYGFTILSVDVIEIAQYMQNEDVNESFALMRACRVVFGMSLIQFSFSLAAVKKRNMKLTGILRMIDIILSTESWSLILGIFSQELPCFIIRMILSTSVLSDKDYALHYLALKNFLMVILLSYRVVVICWKQVQYERKIQSSKD